MAMQLTISTYLAFNYVVGAIPHMKRENCTNNTSNNFVFKFSNGLTYIHVAHNMCANVKIF